MWHTVAEEEAMGRDVEVGALSVFIKDIIVNIGVDMIHSGIGHIISKFLPHQYIYSHIFIHHSFFLSLKCRAFLSGK